LLNTVEPYLLYSCFFLDDIDFFMEAFI
jgi:hypothetical protein